MSELVQEQKMDRRPIQIAALVLLAALLTMLLETSGLLTTLEYKGYDRLMYLKYKTTPEKAWPPDSPVVLVAVDNRTLAEDRFQIPQVLWHKYFASVITGLADGGAKVIGLDFLLPKGLFDDLTPGYSQTWLKALLYAKRKGSPVVTGVSRMGGLQITPHPRYLQIIGPEYVALFNLTTDKDDFTRRQRLYSPSENDPQKGLYSFAFLLAKAYRPDLALPAETIYIDFDPAEEPFARFSFSRVYDLVLEGDPDVLRMHFKNKIVLIGETDALSQDRHATPLYHLGGRGHLRTPGVEIVGHTVNTLLDGRFYRDLDIWGRLAVYLLLAAAVCIYTFYGRLGNLIVFSPVLFAAYLGAAFLFLTAARIVFPLVGGALVIVISQTGAFAFRYWVIDRAKRLAEAERAQMKRMLNLAMEVQLSLLPHEAPSFQGLDIAGDSRYCDETGGDYFDFLDIEPRGRGRISLVVGDVSDHGIPSALLMTTARAFIRQRASLPGGLSEIVSDVNRHMARDVEDSGRFMTLYYCEVDRENLTVRWVSAGHDPALLYDRAEDAFEELPGKGPSLGLMDDFDYPEFEKAVRPGQILAMATDGVWESPNLQDEQFGKEAFMEIIRQHADQPAQAILEAVFAAVEAHLSPRHRADDVTLVVVKVE